MFDLFTLPASGLRRGFAGRASITLVTLFLSVSVFGQSGPPRGSGPGGFGGGGPEKIGHPRRPPEIKSLKREDFDKAVTAMFRKADVDSDGLLTLAELQTEIDARRASVITTRFRHVDTNGSGSIDLTEFTTWQRQMGSVALSDDQRSRIDEALVPAVIGPELGHKEEDLLLQDLVEPLNATMLVEANANHDTGATLAELITYEGVRFQTADIDHDGRISPDEMRLLRSKMEIHPEGVSGGIPARPPR